VIGLRRLLLGGGALVAASSITTLALASLRIAAEQAGARSGFETAISTPGPAPALAVQALDASGGVFGVSPTIPG
jgi:energy-converting hydrogenase Eha subunit A